MDKNKDKHMGNSNPSRPKGRIFGFWPKKSTKVEPQPTDEIFDENGCANKENDRNHSKNDRISFAKCSPVKRIKTQQQQQSRQQEKNNSSQINENKISISNNRKKKKHSNNSNNNRFSHQFNLCCSVDNKCQTPPVTVRYNSLPDSFNLQEKQQQQQHHQQQLQLQQKSSDILTNTPPLAECELECYSAPESPINKKTSSILFNSHSSPSSTTSVQSTQSDQPRSIAITACKSRLRLKLLPPGKTMVDSLDTNNGDSITKQHNSSPSILSGNNNQNNDNNNSHTMTTIENDVLAAAVKMTMTTNEIRSISHDGIQSIHRTSLASADSLAKQALMAAQMLSLIPTEKARERNFMAGRLAVNPLLGAGELARVLPTKEARIFVGTWNMNGQSPPKQMNDFVLPTGIEHVPDIVAIGTQESCPERFEWEVTLQETLGPTHILFHSAYLGTLHLAIFLRRDLVWFCSVPEDASMSVRPGTAFRTKGAVAISFALFGTSMLFVTSHLTAHQQKVKERVQDVKRITHALDLPRNLKLRHKSKDVTQNFDSVFWCGDLNFRLSEPREKLLEWIQNTKFPLPAHLPHGYMHTDQLSSVLADGAAFKGFMEANIRFPPTYKYDPGTQHFDTSSKQRAPAYTDRILYKYRSSYLAFRRTSHISGPFHVNQPTPVECLAYDSVPSITSSDHKPVWALFRSIIRPGIDSVPLAAGLFNREVYLEGMRRRLNNTVPGSSAICSIQ